MLVKLKPLHSYFLISLLLCPSNQNKYLIVREPCKINHKLTSKMPVTTLLCIQGLPTFKMLKCMSHSAVFLSVNHLNFQNIIIVYIKSCSISLSIYSDCSIREYQFIWSHVECTLVLCGESIYQHKTLAYTFYYFDASIIK